MEEMVTTIAWRLLVYLSNLSYEKCTKEFSTRTNKALARRRLLRRIPRNIDMNKKKRVISKIAAFDDMLGE